MSSQEDLVLHLRLLSGDPTATLDCIERWLPWLCVRLAASFPQVAAADEHTIPTAAIDALLDYTLNPHRYKPKLRSLGGYLLMSARGDLLNALKREQTRQGGAIPIDDVEERLASRNKGPEEEVIERAEAEVAWELVTGEITDPLDRSILVLLLQGERATPPYAMLLGLTGLPREKQQSEVKRHKDRINVRLRRLGPRLAEPPTAEGDAESRAAVMDDYRGAAPPEGERPEHG